MQSGVLSPFTCPSYVLPFWFSLAVVAALKLWVAAFGTFLLARALGMRWWAALLGGVGVRLLALHGHVAGLAAVERLGAAAVAAARRSTASIRRPDAVGGRAAGARDRACSSSAGIPSRRFHVLRRGRAVRRPAALAGRGRTRAARRPGDPGPGGRRPRWRRSCCCRSSSSSRIRATSPSGRTAPPAHLRRSYLLSVAMPEYWGRPTQVMLEPFINARAFYVGALPLLLALHRGPAPDARADRAARRPPSSPRDRGRDPAVLPDRQPRPRLLHGDQHAPGDRHAASALALLAAFGLDDVLAGRARRPKVLLAVAVVLPALIVLVHAPVRLSQLGDAAGIAAGAGRRDGQGEPRGPAADVSRAGLARARGRRRGGGPVAPDPGADRGDRRAGPRAVRDGPEPVDPAGPRQAAHDRGDQVPAGAPAGALRRARARFRDHADPRGRGDALRAPGRARLRLPDRRSLRRALEARGRAEAAVHPADHAGDHDAAVAEGRSGCSASAASSGSRATGGCRCRSPTTGRTPAIYDNPRALPRAWVVPSARPVRRPAGRGHRAGVRPAPRGGHGGRPAGRGQRRGGHDHEGAGRPRRRCAPRARGCWSCRTPGIPGWHATVDGHDAKIERVDQMLRGVRLSPGAHTVEMAYRPASFRIGWIVSLVTALALLAGVAHRPEAPRVSALRRRPTLAAALLCLAMSLVFVGQGLLPGPDAVELRLVLVQGAVVLRQARRACSARRTPSSTTPRQSCIRSPASPGTSCPTSRSGTRRS